MDLSQFLDVTCDEGDAEELNHIAADDDEIVLSDADSMPPAPAPARGSKKRSLSNAASSAGRGSQPPKRVRRGAAAPVMTYGRGAGNQLPQIRAGTALPIQRKQQVKGRGGAKFSPKVLGLINSPNLTVSKVIGDVKGKPKQQPQTANGQKQILQQQRALQQQVQARARQQQQQMMMASSITWKYRQLAENQYTADIKKAELLKNYEPEKCMCREPEEGDMACGDGCINRGTFTECDPDVCVYKERCANQRIQRRLYAPGLERFMTPKKGWGVRARQSIAKGSFILEYTGEVCSNREFERRMVAQYKSDRHHYCLGLDSRTMIDAHRAGSECRFVNHGCDPNCEMEKWTVNGLPRMALFAKKDILAGEEISYDYNFSLFNTDMGQECKCGAASCRGVIGGKSKDFVVRVDPSQLSGNAAAKLAANGEISIVSVNGGGGGAQSKQQKIQVATDPNGQVAADAKWFRQNVSEEEQIWLSKNAPKVHHLEAKSIKCTVCNEVLNFRVMGQVQRHPELGVIMCNKCRKNYGKGGWLKDGEGNDEFCRWCSQGGQIYLCDFCPKAFCNQCLKWNLGRKYVKKIEGEEKWKCLSCDPTTIKEARADYYAIHIYHRDRAAKMLKQATPTKAGGGPRKRNGSVNGAKVGGRQVAGAQANGSLNGRPNGMSPQARRFQKHFIDDMLQDADRTFNHFRLRVTEIRKTWYTWSAKRDSKTVQSITTELRDTLASVNEMISATDEKIVATYREHVSDPNFADIEPLRGGGGGHEEGAADVNEVVEEVRVEDEDDNASVPAEVVDQAENGTNGNGEDAEAESDSALTNGNANNDHDVDDDDVIVESASDQADAAENNGDAESTPDEGDAVDLKAKKDRDDEEEEEGIHDMSVDELDGDEVVVAEQPKVEAEVSDKGGVDGGKEQTIKEDETPNGADESQVKEDETLNGNGDASDEHEEAAEEENVSDADNRPDEEGADSNDTAEKVKAPLEEGREANTGTETTTETSPDAEAANTPETVEEDTKEAAGDVDKAVPAEDVDEAEPEEPETVGKSSESKAQADVNNEDDIVESDANKDDINGSGDASNPESENATQINDQNGTESSVST